MKNVEKNENQEKQGKAKATSQSKSGVKPLQNKRVLFLSPFAVEEELLNLIKEANLVDCSFYLNAHYFTIKELKRCVHETKSKIIVGVGHYASCLLFKRRLHYGKSNYSKHLQCSFVSMPFLTKENKEQVVHCLGIVNRLAIKK